MDNVVLAKPNPCSLKDVCKSILIFYITILVFTLNFTALYNESMTDSQVSWWLAFLASIIFNCALSVTVLAFLVYTDRRGAAQADDISNTLRSAAGPSSSFKTVLTIASKGPNDLDPLQQPPALISRPPQPSQLEQRDDNTGFPDLSAQPGAAKTLPSVTVVDLTAIKAKKRSSPDKFVKMDSSLKEPINLATVSDQLINKNVTTKDKEYKKKVKKKKVKKQS